MRVSSLGPGPPARPRASDRERHGPWCQLWCVTLSTMVPVVTRQASGAPARPTLLIESRKVTHRTSNRVHKPVAEQLFLFGSIFLLLDQASGSAVPRWDIQVWSFERAGSTELGHPAEWDPLPLISAMMWGGGKEWNSSGKAKPTRPINGSEHKGRAARLYTLNLLSPIGWSL